MLASVATFALEGVDSREVTVEVDVRRGLPAFAIVGLPDTAVRESRERVRAALLNSGLEFPQQRLTANLAPAYVRKAGPRFDLALAVAVLAASRQVPTDELATYAICGELSLSGAVRPVNGALSMALGARRAGYARLLVPEENASEAALVDGIEILGVPELRRLVAVLKGEWRPEPPRVDQRPAGVAPEGPDLADVRGQADGKRALEIAAAGGHNLLMIGPPGAGKTFLARCLAGILPPPTFEEAIEITQVQSAAGMSGGRLAERRPFRAPHHTISAPGLVGGGAQPRPGEITLAHHGVLFLDELPEFSRDALEALREPLEEGFVTITRGQRTLTFPARTMLVAACNACPCARPPAECTCATPDFARYDRRVSGPLLDRLDLVCRLGPVAPLELVGESDRAGGSSAARERVRAARELQRERLAGTARASNAAMDTRLTRRLVPLEPAARRRLLEGHRVLGLTARAHDRVVRVARTIADLEGREHVTAQDLDEALGYRVGPGARLAA